MSGEATVSGPDLEHAFAASSLRDGEPLLGHVGDEPVIVVKTTTGIFATGATCSHYGGPLGEGIVVDGTVRCPWHHACFDLRTGRALGGPALGSLACFDVIREGDLVRIGKKPEAKPTTPISESATKTSVVIVGAGPAGTACAVTLRQEGYEGAITLIGAELPGPVDRPNLSKDYLAGTAPEEWVALRTEEALREQRIELLANDEVVAIDTGARTVKLASGKTASYTTLVMASGATASKLTIPGVELPHVHTLRKLADAKAIIARLPDAKHAVVLGSSFIGLEVAASLRSRGLEVTVVGREQTPLAHVLGDSVGSFVRSVHASKGTNFRLDVTPVAITATHVELSDGTSLPAELVVMGVGVRPRTDLAEKASLRVDNGIVVDAELRTSRPDVFAVGDVARYPYDGSMVRIEHFAVAARHGQYVARQIAGTQGPTSCVPFFWSQHHDVTLSYVGHAEHFDTPEVHGDLSKGDATVVYRHGGRIRAVLTVGRDKAGLLAESAMERGDQAALEELVRV